MNIVYTKKSSILVFWITKLLPLDDQFLTKWHCLLLFEKQIIHCRQISNAYMNFVAITLIRHETHLII